MTVLDQLPGVYFQIGPPQPAEILPRMDIAAFIGLAASGPIHIPVAVEDVTRFHDIFGAALPLAWDAARGQMQTAYLAPAVEAFFNNGGRRCWVVRVAESAEVNIFPIPGLVRVDDWQPALSQARSAGSWSDPLRVGTIRGGLTIGLAKTPDPSGADLPDFQGEPGDYRLGLRTGPNQIQVDDLLQLSFGREGPLLFLVVADVAIAEDSQLVSGSQAYWFRRYHAASPPLVVEDATLTLLTGRSEESLTLIDITLPASADELYEVEFEQVSDIEPAQGHLLRLDFTGGQQLLLPLMTVVETSAVDSLPLRRWYVSSQMGFWPVSEAAGLVEAAPHDLAVEQTTFELLAWQSQEVQARLQNLAFKATHPRGWTNLPTDETLFGSTLEQPVLDTLDELTADAVEPRFPLAGPEEPANLYLPLGMLTYPDPQASHGPLDEPDPGTNLQRNGLTKFSADLFLDPDLALVGYRALMAEANFKRYLRDGTGKPLLGLHSVLPLEEITIIAVPDAIQPGWALSSPPPLEVLLPTVLELAQPPDDAGHYVLEWQAVSGVANYSLQEATEPTFGQPTTRYVGPDRTRTLAAHDDQTQTYYYRVQVAGDDQLGPWSNTISLTTPPPDFEACGFQPLEAPQLSLTSVGSPPQTELLLTWPAVLGASSYYLEEATDPAFYTAEEIYSGPQTVTELSGAQSDVTYYRVRAQREAEVGPWSNTEVYVVRPDQAWEMTSIEDYDDGDLLAVQRALLRFSGARGDLLSVLTLPAHYREEEALAHAASVMPYSRLNGSQPTGSGQLQIHPLTTGEDYTFSFGTLYHPWIMQVNSTSTLASLIPPDGAVCGSMAAVSIANGAWFAPANRPLRGVVALEPKISRSGWSRLYADQINLLRQDPHGFLLLSAETLSVDPDLRPINVRRFLIMLRRLALREGAKFVFEPNDQRFRDLIQHKFELLLTDLYQRGALVGTTPAEAFRVVVDESVNTQTSIEQGRFIIELRVAPSRPLAFLTVRLVQRNDQSLTALEV